MKTVKIGKQLWMTENLNLSHFRNGDPIPQAKTDNDWFEAGIRKRPAWCYYNNDPANGEKYGKLYNWYAVNDPRGLAPSGWRVPSDGDWTELTKYVGMDEVVSKLKSNSGWPLNENGTNDFGFTALPGSTRHLNGSFDIECDESYWWSSTVDDSDNAWRRSIQIFEPELIRGSYTKESGCSVRCIRSE